MNRKLEKQMQQREEYENAWKEKEGRAFWWCAAALAAVVLASMLWVTNAEADDELAPADLLALELDEGELRLGQIGDDHITLQRHGNQTVGNVGDKRVYIHKTETDNWSMTTGWIGDEPVFITEWDFSDDDE